MASDRDYYQVLCGLGTVRVIRRGEDATERFSRVTTYLLVAFLARRQDDCPGIEIFAPRRRRQTRIVATLRYHAVTDLHHSSDVKCFEKPFHDEFDLVVLQGVG